MSNTYLRREKARKCPVHTTILEVATTQLAEFGYFSKGDVLRENSLEAMEPAVRWDYIREFIEADYGIELVPLAQRFFDTVGKETHRRGGFTVETAVHRALYPQKYVAAGHGKRTAGYCNADFDNGRFAVVRLQHKREMLNGVAKAFNKFSEELAKREITQNALEAKAPPEATIDALYPNGAPSIPTPKYPELLEDT